MVLAVVPLGKHLSTVPSAKPAIPIARAYRVLLLLFLSLFRSFYFISFQCFLVLRHLEYNARGMLCIQATIVVKCGESNHFTSLSFAFSL